MSKPKVSVVIPIWNTEKYLEKCLDSIVNQTLKDIEIICVDNGSTDSCPQILEGYVQRDTRIKLITKNHGCLSSARNAGLEVATAPYITFVDSDDWVEARCYEVALKAFEDDSEIDIVCWGANIVNCGMDETSQYLKNAKSYHKIKLKGIKTLNDNVILSSTVCVWNKLFKTSIIKEKNVLFPLNIELEDNSFFFCYILNCKKAHYLDEYFYNYVQRKNSSLEKIRAGTSDIIAPMLKNMQYIIDYCKNNGLAEKGTDLSSKTIYGWLNADYRDAAVQNKIKVLEIARKTFENFSYGLSDFRVIKLLESLKNKDYKSCVSILENKPCLLFGNLLFSIFYNYSRQRVIIKFLGINISFKYKGGIK